uniref:Uncharacterized protein n=1 Tax=Glossina palpalis gambiensis TaxID=67801 RepID=A0A1B0ASM5_9MUSC
MCSYKGLSQPCSVVDGKGPFLLVGSLSSTLPPQSRTSRTFVNLNAPTRAAIHRTTILKSQAQTKAYQGFTTLSTLKYLWQDVLENKNEKLSYKGLSQPCSVVDGKGPFLLVGSLSSTLPPQSRTSRTFVNLNAPTRAAIHRTTILKSQAQTKAYQGFTTLSTLKYLWQDRPQALHTGSPLALRRQRVVVVVLQFAHEVPALLAALCNDCRAYLNKCREECHKEGYLSNVLRHFDGLSAVKLQ